jgi:hypothetical protein
MVDSLKDKLHIAQSDVATMQQKQQQQVSRSSLGSERRSLPLRNNMSSSDLSRVESVEHLITQHSHIDSPTSDSGSRQLSTAGTPLVSLDKLLSTEMAQVTAPVPLSPTVSQLSAVDVRQQLMAANKRIDHLTEVLGESEATSMRLSDQAKLLKEEIRRLERNKEREESISNMEYLKNVVLKFLHTESEQEQLLPVISNLLKLSQQEKVFLEQVVKGKNPDLPQLAKGESPHLQGNKEKGWSSYIHRWTGY